MKTLEQLQETYPGCYPENAFQTRMYRASLHLNMLLDNYDAESARNFKQLCNGRDDCIALVTDGRVEDYEGQCKACWKSSHFTCKECLEELDVADRHDTVKGHCENCGNVKLTDEIDSLRSDIEDFLEPGDYEGQAGTIVRLKKILAYAKKLEKA